MFDSGVGRFCLGAALMIPFVVLLNCVDVGHLLYRRWYNEKIATHRWNQPVRDYDGSGAFGRMYLEILQAPINPSMPRQLRDCIVWVRGLSLYLGAFVVVATVWQVFF